MIAYSRMTLKEACDEVMLRTAQSRTASNLDYGVIRRFVQDARRELFNRVVPFKDYAFIKTVAVTANLQALPADYVRPVRVILNSGGQNREARRVDPREWNVLVNGNRPHTYVQPTVSEPVYMIWANTVTSNTLWSQTNMAIWVAPSASVGQLDYYAQYDDSSLTADTDTVNVPAEAETMLINLVLQRVYAKIADRDKLRSTVMAMRSMLADVERQRQATQVTTAVNIESLVNPEPAQVPPTTE